jgi:predicted NBD/HSP70 family sugar kinase
VLPAQSGDEQALAGMARIGRYVGIALANVIVLLNPDQIVVSSAVSSSCWYGLSIALARLISA